MRTQYSKYSIFITLPILTYLGSLCYQHMLDRFYFWILDNGNLLLHEFGHFFFYMFWNEFLSMAGGTLIQIILPLIMMIVFLLQLDFFWIATSFGWLWTHLFYIEMYASDAIRQDLPLIWWPGAIHDWNYMFTKLWVLEQTYEIVHYFKIAAIICFIICFSYSFILIINRFRRGSI